jgi:phosphopantothenoylcysteine decarboxylase/phosphopantothenate--cysteine ligase
MKNVLLGVSGSIAAYRAADLARDLMRSGCSVRVCLTDAAQKFVTPALFETLTGQPVLIDTFEEPVSGRMAHIDWARWANVILVAPATANTIAKLARGDAEDMLTTVALAATCPWVIAPAMNPQMYTAEPIQQALKTLKARAAAIVEPQEGDVACGEHGQGKLATNQAIHDRTLEVLNTTQLLKGKRVLITSGPTQEPLDTVRYLSNRSSGKMGAALARAALLMGAEVTVIAGPSTATYPLQAKIHHIKTADEMLDQARQAAPDADIIVAAAAVGDYKIQNPSTTKLRRTQEPLQITLIPNPDIVATLAKENPAARVVAFAAEPTNDLSKAKEKLERKGVYAVASNDVSRQEIGFESDQNELWLVTAHKEPISSGLKSKLACALWLLEQIAPQKTP